MPNLSDVAITFHTHNDKDQATVVHVFVKNRQPTTATPNHATDFASNLAAYNDLLSREDVGSHAANPYIAVGVGLVKNIGFDDSSNQKFHIPLVPLAVQPRLE